MNLLKALTAAAEEAAGIKKVTVGKVSLELLKAFHDHKVSKELTEVNANIQALTYRKQWLLGEITSEEADKLQDELDLLEKKVNREAEKKHTDLWARVYEELDLEDTEKGYTISHKTGVVTTKERVKEEAEQGQGVH